MPRERHVAKPTTRRKPGPKKGPPKIKCKPATGGLNLRQQEALNFYFLNGGDKKAALLAAGYSATTAETNTKSVFDHPLIVKRIQEFHAERARKVEVTKEWVLERLKRVADMNIGNVLLKLQQNSMDLACLTEDERYAIGEIVRKSYMVGRGKGAVEHSELKIKGKDTLQSLAMLMRHLGMNNDKMVVEHTVSLADRLRRGRDRVRAAGSPPVIDVDPTTGKKVK